MLAGGGVEVLDEVAGAVVVVVDAEGGVVVEGGGVEVLVEVDGESDDVVVDVVVVEVVSTGGTVAGFVDTDVVVNVDVWSNTCTGRRVNGDDGNTGSGSPGGGNVAAGSC